MAEWSDQANLVALWPGVVPTGNLFRAVALRGRMHMRVVSMHALELTPDEAQRIETAEQQTLTKRDAWLHAL